MVRLHVISAIYWPSFLFLKFYYFSKYEHIIEYAFLGQSGHTGCILYIWLYMMHTAIYACTYVGCMLPV